MLKVKDIKMFRQEIQKRGYTFKKFAETVGMSYYSLQKIFIRETISPPNAKKYCDAIGIDFDILFETN